MRSLDSVSLAASLALSSKSARSAIPPVGPGSAGRGAVFDDHEGAGERGRGTTGRRCLRQGFGAFINDFRPGDDTALSGTPDLDKHGVVNELLVQRLPTFQESLVSLRERELRQCRASRLRCISRRAMSHSPAKGLLGQHRGHACAHGSDDVDVLDVPAFLHAHADDDADGRLRILHVLKRGKRRLLLLAR